MLTQGVDVLLVAPHNGKTAAFIVEAAHRAGVPVIAYDRLINNADVDLYMSFDNERPPLDWKSATWLPVWLIGMGIISWQGQYSGAASGREGAMPTALRWSDTRVTRWSGPVSQSQSEAVSA